MEAIFSLIALIGMGYAAFRGIKWLNKASHAYSQKESPLTPNDLKVLEESAARLINDLRTVTDECVARIEEACARAENRVSIVDSIGSQMPSVPNKLPMQYNIPAEMNSSISTVQTTDESLVNAARQSGMTTGEIELLRSLQSIAK